MQERPAQRNACRLLLERDRLLAARDPSGALATRNGAIDVEEDGTPRDSEERLSRGDRKIPLDGGRAAAS